MPDATSLWPLNFVRCRLIFVGPRYNNWLLAGRSEVWIPAEERDLFFPLKPTRLVLGPTPPPIQFISPFFPGGKAAGVWSWPLTSMECRGWEWAEVYLYSLFVDRKNFTFFSFTVWNLCHVTFLMARFCRRPVGMLGKFVRPCNMPFSAKFCTVWPSQARACDVVKQQFLSFSRSPRPTPFCLERRWRASSSAAQTVNVALDPLLQLQPPTP
jgi:hypothetical protein